MNPFLLIPLGSSQNQTISLSVCKLLVLSSFLKTHSFTKKVLPSPNYTSCNCSLSHLQLSIYHKSLLTSPNTLPCLCSFLHVFLDGRAKVLKVIPLNTTTPCTFSVPPAFLSFIHGFCPAPTNFHCSALQSSYLYFSGLSSTSPQIAKSSTII